MSGWALITGSARRIGRAIALDLAAHGWDIVIHYHKSQKDAQSLADEIQKMGQNACLAEIDLSNAHLCENLIPSLAEEIGMIDALINNASLFEPDALDSDGARHWAINADAPRLLSKAFRDHIPSHERGVIVNLLDGTEAPPHFEGYARSKAFLADITQTMAKSFAPKIRVHGIAPLFVLPSPRQSEASFLKQSEGKRVAIHELTKLVRSLVSDKALPGKIVTMRASSP